MSYWYIAHDNELLLDLDRYDRRTRTGDKWGEVFFRRRLRDAVNSGKLEVNSVWLAESNSSGHYHAIVELVEPMPAIERLVWQMHLGSDLYRARADMMREIRGDIAPSLLIRGKKIGGFYRDPDHECTCRKKHRTDENPRCKVWRELRGTTPWELWGQPLLDNNGHHIEEREVKLPCGEVGIDLILQVRKK